jgi:hypothetical protein
VAGVESLDVCLGLYRRGYDHAICRSVAPAPHTPEQTADVLWLLSIPTEANPIEALSHLGRDLRPGGRLVIRLPRGASPDRIRRLRRALLDRGFLPTATIEDLTAANTLVCARKSGALQARAA